MPKQKLFSALSLLGFVFILYLGFQAYQDHKTRGERLTQQIEVPANFAREFSRVIKKNRQETLPSTPFISPDGQTMDWDDFEDDYLLVNFWATWCAPCVVELPALDKLQQKYEGQGLQVIAVSLDTMRSHDFIKKFLDNRYIGTFAAYFDNSRIIQETISMRGIPTSYLIDPAGNILHIFEGDANWASPSAYKFFDSVLGKEN